MLIFIIVILIIVNIILDLKLKNNNDENIIIEDKDYKEFYYKKECLLTQTELKFYKLLKIITDKNNYTLFAQVPLYGLINYKEYKYFNKIKSKSIDFVITQNNCKVLMCIELDDKSHYNKKRIERDKFVNKLFNDLNIKLIRIPVQSFYNMEELEKKIIG